MSIKINGVTKEETAYDKLIQFTYAGEQYRVLLHWDTHDGFDLAFSDRQGYYTNLHTPDWAVEWNEDEHDGESLELLLDSLTDRVIEESY